MAAPSDSSYSRKGKGKLDELEDAPPVEENQAEETEKKLLDVVEEQRLRNIAYSINPKRAPSAFHIYIEDSKRTSAEENPNAMEAFKEDFLKHVENHCYTTWQSLPYQVKAKYEITARKLREDYAEGNYNKN